MNRYYLYFVKIEKVIGPYSFKKALVEKTWFESCGEVTEILKIVVDIYGKEVK